MPVDLSNEAYKFGVNYVMYAMTHLTGREAEVFRRRPKQASGLRRSLVDASR